MQILGGFGAGLAILLVFTAWKLSTGPISLTFLTPHIERALNASTQGVQVRLDDTILTWAGWERTLDIRAVGVRIVSRQGEVVAAVPELSLSLSARALVNGKIAPKRIELFRPRLWVVRTTEGGMQLGFEDVQNASQVGFRRALDQLLSPSREEEGLKYLSNLNIFDATFTIVDESLGTAWRAPNTQVLLTRDAKGINGEIDLNLVVNDGRNAALKIRGGYRTARRSLEFAVAFSNLNPSEFAEISDKIGILKALRAPVDGTVSVAMGLDGGVESVGFDLISDAGQVDVPAPAAQTIDIQNAILKGTYSENRIDFETLHLDLGDEGVVMLPPPVNHAMPVRAITLVGSYNTKTDFLDLADGLADLRGPVLNVAAQIDGLFGHPKVQGTATLENVPTDELKVYWPAALGQNPYRWVTKHLSKGRLKEVRAKLALTTGDDGDVEKFSISGSLDVEGVSVDYLPPMPKVLGVSGTATFDETAFRIKTRSGKVEGLRVTDGQLDFTEFQAKDQWADIALTIDGPLRDAVKLIDHKPLNFASSLGLDPSQMKGASRTNVKLRFPLLNDLTFEQVEVAAATSLVDLEVSGLEAGMKLSNGRIEMRVDKKGLEASGTADLRGFPTSLKWRENFRSEAPFKSRYALDFRADATRFAETFGLDFMPFKDGGLTGSFGAKMVYTADHKKGGILAADTDLTDATIDFPALAWRKVPGSPGKSHIEVVVKDGKLAGVPKLSVEAADLKFSGAMTFADDSRVDRFDIEHLSFGRTDVRGLLVQGKDKGWTATLHGTSVDIEPFMESMFKEEAGTGKDGESKTPFSLSFDVAKIRLGEDRYVTDVIGTMARTTKAWSRIVLDGRLATDGHLFAVRLEPADGANRRLRVQADDAGAMLRALDLYEYMKGGVLQLEGEFDDSRPSAPLKGLLQVRDYRIIKAPGLARLVSILSLTGIFDALQGEGLGFATLRIPFNFEQGVLEIADARASGVSLGFTANGTVYTHADMVDMEGTLVPAYALNSALGRLPLIGRLFSGGEEGGGVFAATYRLQGPIEDPRISVNPLTALAPGFLRGLFGNLDRDDDTPALPPREPEFPTPLGPPVLLTPTLPLDLRRP